MTTADAHTLTGAYALDAVTDLERAAFTRHLAECPVCAVEVAGFQETAALLGGAATLAPDERARRRVLAMVAQTRQLPPLVTAEPVGRKQRAPWRRRALVGVASVAAAAAALIGGISIGLDHPGSAPVPGAEGNAVTAAPDAITVRTAATGGGAITATISPRLGRVLVAAHALPSLDAGHAYEVWLTGPHGPRSAGLVGSGGTVEATVPQDTDGIAVTVEPATGSLQPTTPPIAALAVG
ncbi:anti-sigma factor domain-containing protein [Amycolatopsis sp. CA-128772]|uniref:anti-sigma factor n=1 Tax=Amycolatopsis sp. CA-128772 TaxID=2073159 RepID=UPI000CD091B5|nr:anti-sigma factor [Amycolatopsis sp. CA-128772]